MKRQSGFNRYFPGTVFHLFILLSCVVSFFPFVAWGAPTYTFKLGNSVAEDHPYTLGCLRFKELVEERTKGDIVINVFPNGQLGTGERDLIEGLQLGTVPHLQTAAANFSRPLYPEVQDLCPQRDRKSVV